jgi:hypothetical protein
MTLKLHLLNQIPGAVFLEQLAIIHLVKTFSFPRPRMIIIVFTRTNWPLSGASATQSTPSHQTSIYCLFNDAVNSSDCKHRMVKVHVQGVAVLN